MKYAVSFVIGGLAVAIGAFGAHALAPYMSEYGKDIFTTGNRYHFYHALLMVAICMLISRGGAHRLLTTAWYFAGIGILFFSGSLYLLAIRGAHSIPAAILGPVTPLGGTFFMVSWILMAMYAWKHLKN